MDREIKDNKKVGWRESLFSAIFESNTPTGKLFDIVLIVIIFLSVATVMLDSVNSIELKYGKYLRIAEWTFTILFTIEYILRLICSKNHVSYLFSFFGIVDLLSIAPTYISIFLPGSQFLIVIRILRVLRIFRVLKLVKYVGESNLLLGALQASQRKITVFLFSVVTIVIIFGSLMYIVEGEKHGFTSIPRGIYWAVVTLTTVGYGDITPKTNIGQMLSSVIMIMGYGIIAVPTGIVTAEITSAMGHNKVATITCSGCKYKWHDDDAVFCKHCGAKL